MFPKLPVMFPMYDKFAQMFLLYCNKLLKINLVLESVLSFIYFFPHFNHSVESLLWDGEGFDSTVPINNKLHTILSNSHSQCRRRRNNVWMVQLLLSPDNCCHSNWIRLSVGLSNKPHKNEHKFRDWIRGIVTVCIIVCVVAHNFIRQDDPIVCRQSNVLAAVKWFNNPTWNVGERCSNVPRRRIPMAMHSLLPHSHYVCVAIQIAKRSMMAWAPARHIKRCAMLRVVQTSTETVGIMHHLMFNKFYLYHFVNWVLRAV